MESRLQEKADSQRTVGKFQNEMNWKVRKIWEEHWKLILNRNVKRWRNWRTKKS
jgi:hypothetical protein